ncbi:uncharacterized protein SPPG_05495 [Spizellomyces punctatus DAOM BR117]|uniref:Peptidyl-prolyl cis-trans isomerase n=1 Tax=Spizellomyces punctatus (strain DAOM BR117) TaxID=645134 RepID=A0A0L0HE40_SPIPD|nr:uncharacterized protein SPPG_05495 [Spizellomyces punctatus DAOM BR117]KNC99239.1 hypothetical protein SPPG_05495 [Spizellomyces punctatus DAOM BR117]|eukprot:XP_016607279.1 hypothetical protein SPPG_05495 [Spizellomyces punctatus DAOM BR117]
MPHAFLDIHIGDAAAHAALQSAYERTIGFIAAKSSELAVDPLCKPEDLADWQQEMAVEMYNSDPTWQEKGPIRLTPPPPPRGGRILFTLYADKCPKTVTNFLALCTGSKGLSKSTKKPLHYKSIPIHRIVRGFVAQGGDITRYDGSGGDSIYGGTFNDEKEGLKLKFEKGVLAMANSGKNSNTSQFFVTLGEDPKKLAKMDGKYVVFGKVVEGWEVLDLLDAVGTDDGRPRDQVQIVDCGELP